MCCDGCSGRNLWCAPEAFYMWAHGGGSSNSGRAAMQLSSMVEQATSPPQARGLARMATRSQRSNNSLFGHRRARWQGLGDGECVSEEPRTPTVREQALGKCEIAVAGAVRFGRS